MTDLQLFTLRNDIAFYACIVCSVAAHHAVMGAVWLVLGLVILILGKVKRSREPQLGDRKP